MFTLTPYFNFSHHSDSDLYSLKEMELNYLEAGFQIDYAYNKISLESNFSYHFYDCLNQRPNDFNRIEGLVIRWPTFLFNNKDLPCNLIFFPSFEI